jgi:hypothetical protein
MNTQKTKHPGWPANFSGPSLTEWLQKTDFPRVPLGTGILGSDIGLPEIYPIGAPHPEFVKEWRSSKGASVAETAAYFGLINSQVLQATAE